MDSAAIDAYLLHLDDVIGRGRQLCGTLRRAPEDREALAGARIWQHDCESIVTALSGGSKSHWLSRAYSDALLVRADGQALERADVGDIVNRIVGVLEQAARSLAAAGSAASSPAEPPPPHRFDFVHNRDLRPVLEQAYVESRDALERREFERALATTCGILEAIITDALAHVRYAAADIAALSFEDRIAAAERAGLITSACARLPPAARSYRDGGDRTVVERDARMAGQVLHVVLRDLNPGR
ncbi:MAG: hypothetical protein DMF98_20985 [Acidobacteria bacterium]|nr:MAG: hypothetical protein DMF98_20985 [Acidobacteriota bacterium]